MNLRGTKRLIGRAVAVLGAVAAVAGGWSGYNRATNQQALKNTNLTDIRQQALTMFPRGSRLDAAAGHLAGIGFDCQAMKHFLADTSAPSMLCASNGRGFPDYPAINMTLFTRNGLIADIEIWNVMARADSDLDDVDMTATGSIRRRRTAAPAGTDRPGR